MNQTDVVLGSFLFWFFVASVYPRGLSLLMARTYRGYSLILLLLGLIMILFPVNKWTIASEPIGKGLAALCIVLGVQLLMGLSASVGTLGAHKTQTVGNQPVLSEDAPPSVPVDSKSSEPRA